MALEFNADKERIVSSNLELRNATSFNQILGSGANQKSAIFSNLTQDIDALVRVGVNTSSPQYELDVNGQIRTTTSIISDTARINNLDIDTIVNPFLAIKAPDLTTYTDPETGITSFPTSATPAFFDDSTKIATTNFVYNIATNDVGGRIYVSQQIGSDEFDGRSATKPVRSIKRAAQLASITDDKETLIVAGGEYLEDNPISLPPKCSVVGDNIRLVICRPQNPGKHMFKAASENYVFGLTFRDQIDELGNATDTWGFAYVFDDKQRVFYDKNLGGTFGRNFPVGYQYFGEQKFQVGFSENSPVTVAVGMTITSSSGGSATITEVNYDEGTSLTGSFIIESVTGAFDRDDILTYQDQATTKTLVAKTLTSQRSEGEVVKHVTDHDSYIVTNITASDDYPDGLIFELNQYHDYEVGQHVEIANLPDTGTWADLNRFNGRQYVSHRIETTDGFSTKFVVFKDSPTDILGINSGGSPSFAPSNVTVESADNYVVLSLLNSPFKFEDNLPNPQRYIDAVDLIQRNKEYISEEAVGRVQAEYPGVSFNTAKCERDIGIILDHISHDLKYGGNAATVEASERYLVGGSVGFVNNELQETLYGFREARELAIEALRNVLPTGTYTSETPYTDTTIVIDPTTAVSQKAGSAYRLINKNKNLIAHEAFYLMTQQFPSWTPPNGTANQDCIDDILANIDVIAYNLLYGGNDRTYDAGNVYITNTLNGVTYSRTIEDGERDESVYAYEQARDLAIDVIRNNIISVQGSHGFIQYRDLTVTVDPASPTCQTEASAITTLFGIITQAIGSDATGVGNLNGITRTLPAVATTYNGLGCANVVSAVYTLFDILLDILQGEASPSRTQPSSHVEDQDGNTIAVQLPWDDLPIIEVSPYIFNSSVISFAGGGGCEIDGTKVATPNVARPNIPEQGKSMVAAAFTIISFGGVGYKVVEDGYTQLVSCFVIFCQDGVFADTGGYASITNSATNFGTYALRATGYRREPYSFNRGTIQAVEFDEIGIPTITTNALQGAPLEHYIIKIGGVVNGNEGVTIEKDSETEFFIEQVESISAGPPFTVAMKVNAKMYLFGNNSRYNDAYNLLTNNAEYIGDEAVGLIQNYTTLATVYNPADASTYEVGDIVSENGSYYIAQRYIGIGPKTSIPGGLDWSLIVQSGETIGFQPDIEKCRRDTKLIVESWAQDLLEDSNSTTWDAAKLYIDAVNGGVIHVNGFEDGTKAVFRAAAALSKLAINNLLRKSSYSRSAQEILNGVYVAQYTTETPYLDLTITDSGDDSDLSEYTTGDCSDVQLSIGTLLALTEEILDETEVTSGLVRNNGGFLLSVANKDKIIGKNIAFHRPSIVNSSSHTWEYAGSGNNYTALPQNGGQRGSSDTKVFEQVSQRYGRVYASGTDELGDFKVGYFANIENRTGNITFGGTVEIEEVSFLRISGGDIVIEGFSADNTLGGIFSSDALLPTQKAVKDYITNNLGNYINKTYSTNPTPRALVELGDNGRINIDQIPALRPFNVFTVADQAERLALEGALAGDIAIQQDISLSFILNEDSEFQVLEIAPNPEYTISNGDVITASPSTSQGTITSITEGYIDSIFITNPGNSYTAAPSIFVGTSASSKISQRVYSDEQVANNSNLYTITNSTTLPGGSATPPTHTTGVVISDDVEYTYVDALPWAVGISPIVDEIIFNSSGEVYRVTAVDTATTGGNEPTHTGLRQIVTGNDAFAYEYIGTVWSSTGTHGHGVALKYYSHLDSGTGSVNVYTTRATAISSTTQPSHTSGTVTHGDVTYQYVGDQATATATIANNRVSSITITDPGSGYTSDPIVVFTNDPGDSTGVDAAATATARTRIAITIENNIKVNSGDTFTDFTVTTGNDQPFTITVLDAVNTSAQNINNWVQLTSSNIDAAFITSGIISTARLAVSDIDYPANSNTFLRGDQKYAQVVQSVRVADDETPIVINSNFTRNSYIEDVLIKDGGTGYTSATYSDQILFGGAGNGATANIVVSDGAVQKVNVTSGGTGYAVPPIITFEDNGGATLASIRAEAIVSGGVIQEINLLDGSTGLASAPTVVITDTSGSGSAASATAVIGDGVISRVTITDGGIGYTADHLVPDTGVPLPSAITTTQVSGDEALLQLNLATRNLNFNTVDFDIRRVSGNTPSSNLYSTVGVARFRKSDINSQRTGQFRFDSDGGVYLDQGVGSGLNADKLDGQEGIWYLDGSNFTDFSIVPSKLSNDTYVISITGSSGTSGILESTDTRTINTQPSATSTEGVQFAWKQNTTLPGNNPNNLWLELDTDEAEQLLNDGGIYHSSLIMRRSGAVTTDFSGGAVNVLSFTDNNNAYIRGSGGNHIASLNIVQGGNGYVPGTYSNVPLGGGEGSGLEATIVVNSSGVISSVQLTNTGHGYDTTGGAGSQFTVQLPESYFGLDNGRVDYDAWEPNVTHNFGEFYFVGNSGGYGRIYEVSTSGTSGTNQLDPPTHTSGSSTAPGGTAVYDFFGFTNAEITAVLASTTSGNWSSYQEIWHAGNDGPNSGLNADKLDNRELEWILSAQNIKRGTLNNRRIPDNLSSKQFTGSVIVNTVDPTKVTNQFKGAIFDFYLEGFAYTNELETLDTSTGVTDPAPNQDYTQLNLYTATDVNQATIQVINTTVNQEESDVYWSANTSIPFDRLVQYGYNLYRSTAVISNTGTNPPLHPNGEQNNLEFIKKIDNPWTILTAELLSGNLNDDVVKVGSALAPATYYDIYDWGVTKDPQYSVQKHELTTDPGGNPLYRLGNDTQISTAQLVFHTSGQTNNYDAKLTVSGGTSTDGQGTFNFEANDAQVNGNSIWHGGNVTFGTGASGTAPALTYDTGANGKAVLRDSNGDFGGRYIVASGNSDAGFIGTATGNLPLSGGTLTGGLTISNGNILTFQTSTNNNARGFIQATETNDAHLIIATSGGEDIAFKDNGVAGDSNFIIRGSGEVEAPLGVFLAKKNAVITAANTGNGVGNTLRLNRPNNSDYENAINWQTNGNDQWFLGLDNNSTEHLYLYSWGQGFVSTYFQDTRNVNIGPSTNDSGYKLRVEGSFAATSKSFVIDHPTKENYQLVYGSLEGPEHGVYVRGKTRDDIIELPEYWTELVDEDTITVQLTSIGNHNSWVDKIEDNKVYIGGGAAFYFIQAERKDIDKLQTEVELTEE